MRQMLLTLVCDPLPNESAALHLLDEIDLIFNRKLVNKRVAPYPKFELCWKLEAELPVAASLKKAPSAGLQLCSPWQISWDDDAGSVECLFNRTEDAAFTRPALTVIRWAQLLIADTGRPN